MKIDFGCGKNKQPGFIGVDDRPFPGVDTLLNLAKDVWPWEKETVDEGYASHFIEHLTAQERVYFVNELHRVLKPSGTCRVIVPHWASCRAYGDLTHQWPPVSEFWFYYLDKAWRAVNAPHNDEYTCDFEVTWGYSLNQSLTMRNIEYQNFALGNYKEAAQDIVATFKKKS